MRLNIGKTRGTLYKAARILGDINAVTGGPEKLVQRVVRKKAGRVAGKGLGSMFNKPKK